ncbi:hypothetical protein F444_22252 [Phytophthora nicotianae P1976]|uniref:Uncharacterized protein n=1 Tax=Phytophthora nicotianae P1976 TaxID=1317066 RepID=A0A080YYB8_PHYNI|nr:hypothetical protein F444_22252 [Phytophthora nicotianae P1976]
MECPRCHAAIVVPPPDPAGENPIALRLCACCEQLLERDAFAKRSEDDEETSGGDDTPKGTHGNVVEDVKRDKGKRVLSQNEKYRAVSAACQRIAEGVAD